MNRHLKAMALTALVLLSVAFGFLAVGTFLALALVWPAAFVCIVVFVCAVMVYPAAFRRVSP